MCKTGLTTNITKERRGRSIAQATTTTDIGEITSLRPEAAIIGMEGEATTPKGQLAQFRALQLQTTLMVQAAMLLTGDEIIQPNSNTILFEKQSRPPVSQLEV